MNPDLVTVDSYYSISIVFHIKILLKGTGTALPFFLSSLGIKILFLKRHNTVVVIGILVV
jgi:hypothetical protein